MTFRAGMARTTALRQVSLTISKGTIVGVMGHTGCGKTTLLQLCAGLLRPSEGTVLLDGEDIFSPRYDRGRLRRRLSMVFQYPECQLFATTVEKDVAFGLKHAGMSQEEVSRRVDWALSTVGFAPETVRPLSPMRLSGGEKRRVAIAGCLATQPEYLLLDEPFAGLDPMGREEFQNLLIRLNRERGMTVVLVSHSADCLAACAGRLVVLEDGRLAADGTPAQLFADTALLERCHLAASQSYRISALLRARGAKLPEDTVTYPQLLDALLRAGKGGGAP